MKDGKSKDMQAGGLVPPTGIIKLEDLKVLRRSPDLFNNVIIGQGFTAYNKTYFV